MHRDLDMFIGKTLTDVYQAGNDEIIFTLDTGERYKMYHDQDCCEAVYIEDIWGDLSDLIGSPIEVAEEVTNYDYPKHTYDESYTWTFYKFRTVNSDVTIRWYGTSNGYYSESVDIVLVDDIIYVPQNLED